MTLLFSLLVPLAWAIEGPDDPQIVDPFEEPDESELFRLDEQLVTVASRYAQTVRKAPSIVTLVTAEDIRRRGHVRLSDVLRDLPGLYVWKSNEGRDVLAVRGVVSSDNNKVLLLVDGVPWYDGVYTHAFIDEYLPISHIRQIEVIKGPGSAIYGTNAFAGVINVVTWSAADLDGGRVRWMAGADGTSDLTGMMGVRRKVGGADVAATAYARLFSQLGDGLDLLPNGRRDVRGDDPKRGMNVGARLQVEDLEMQIHHVDYRHTFLTTEGDDPYDLLAKNLDSFGLYYKDTFFDARYRARISPDVTLTPHLWTQRHDNPGLYFFGSDSKVTTEDGEEVDVLDLTMVETEKDTRRWGGGIDLEGHPGIDHVTVAGAGLENVVVLDLVDRTFPDFDHEWDDSDFQAPERSALRNLFGYVQHTWTALPWLEVTGGVRLDKRVPANGEDPTGNAFDVFTSPRAGLLVVPNDSVTAKLLYGRAFRSPNVRELLVRVEADKDGNYPFSSGNLELRPESIDTLEGELTTEPADPIELALRASWSTLRNEIDKVTPPNEYQNLPGSLDIASAEAEVHAEAGMVELRVAYAFTHARYAEVADNPYSGLQQYEFPPHMLKAGLQLSLSESVSASLIGEGYSIRPRRSWSPDARMEDGDAFGLLHLGIRLAELDKQGRTEIDVSVRNLTNATWGTGVYRDSANSGDPGEPKYPYEIEGDGRQVRIALEIAL